ncbi:MAG TPA: hypothetical protein VFR15_12420 [Chloroflexia bacterium]|nr:hypothetical protein [Chloroflexia bacterium]
MPFITEFPPQYPLTREHVREIEIIGHLTREVWEADPNYDPELPLSFGNFDFHVTLRDGRAYGFVGSLPEYIREYMEQENEDSLISPGLVLIRRVDVASVLHAVEEWLTLGIGTRLGLEHYGVLQKSLED